MGDRGNIVIQDRPRKGRKPERVYLYTHWRGSSITKVAKAALRKRWRWGDSPFLARIVFCELVKGEEGEEAGFGISASITDNEHPVLVIDCDKLTVHYEDEDGSVTTPAVSIEDFIK